MVTIRLRLLKQVASAFMLYGNTQKKWNILILPALIKSSFLEDIDLYPSREVVLNRGKGLVGILKTYTPGFQSEDILPEPVKDWEMYYKMFNNPTIKGYKDTFLK